MPLSGKDKALTRLFMASCFHRWPELPDLCKRCYDVGCNLVEVRGCVRHLIVVAGYAPCLAATNVLHGAKLLEGDSPGKVGGRPGNAFDLVYEGVAEKVQAKLHGADPVLAQYIRLHLYGDVYSSPGLELRQKQLLMIAFLGEADMHEQLFGHALAAMRFGNDAEACLKALDIGFEYSFCPRNEVYKAGLETLKMAHRKHRKDSPETPS